jgi:CheY-like chemotaxis protein
VVSLQLAHFQDLISSRIQLQGPSLLILASAAQTLGMAIHELATNAGKYGALSNAEGRVAVQWSLECDGGTFSISWRERDGPTVAPPSKKGFGSMVIGRLAESSLDAQVDLEFLKTGLSWRLRCPAARIIEGTLSLQAPEAKSERNSPGSSCPKVLVVEDEALVAMEITHVLKGAGFEVLGPARAVAQALSLIDEIGCDVAVLDINLSDETSEPVAHKLMERGTRFITLSGYSRAQHPPIFDDVPALSKPLRPEALVAEIKRCLASKERKPPGPTSR